MRTLLAIGLAMACFAASAKDRTGDSRAGDIWQGLQGRWQGSGEVRGMQAAIRLRFRPAFGGRGYHLDFENRMTAPDGKVWAFAAEALYRCDDVGACSGHWYDSRGVVLPLIVRSSGDALVVEWGDAATERGRTTYRVDGEGRLSILDEVQGDDGEFSTFGRTSAARSGGD